MDIRMNKSINRAVNQSINRPINQSPSGWSGSKARSGPNRLLHVELLYGFPTSSRMIMFSVVVVFVVVVIVVVVVVVVTVVVSRRTVGIHVADMAFLTDES